jgi:hypothetical protein
VAALVERRWPKPPASSLVAQNRMRVDALRDQALVVGVVALVLSFLPVAERLQLGRVSRRWQSALQQPSLWRACGWLLPGQWQPQRVSLPRLVRQRLGTLTCGVDWLLRAGLLSQVRELTSLRRLELLPCEWDEQPDVSCSTLQATLSTLRLEALLLPPLRGPSVRPLLGALTHPIISALSWPPLLTVWGTVAHRAQAQRAD